MIAAPKKIVVSRLQNIGDVVMTTPILYRLKQLFPETELDFVTRPVAEAVVARLPFIDKVVILPDEHPLAAQIAVWKILRGADIAFFCDNTHRIAVLAALAGAKRRIGMRHKRGKFLTDPITWTREMDLEFDPLLYARLLKNTTGIDVTGVPDWNRYLFSEANAAEIAHVEQLMREHDFGNGKPYIVFSLYTGSLIAGHEKNWPEAYWTELWAKLAQKFKTKVIMTGINPKHIVMGNNVVDLTDKTTLYEFGYLVKKASLVVSCCSAPLHVARAFHVPTIGLYGPSPASHAAPPENIATIEAQVPCAGCSGYYSGPTCAKPFCMSKITVDKVYKTVEKFLKERGFE